MNHFYQFLDCMTTSYAALKPFPLPPTSPLTLELATLNVEPEQPYAAFVHHLYVHPLSLNFESQKMFARARNIACSIELKENDSGDNKSLQVSGFMIRGLYAILIYLKCTPFLSNICNYTSIVVYCAEYCINMVLSGAQTEAVYTSVWAKDIRIVITIDVTGNGIYCSTAYLSLINRRYTAE